MNNKNQCIICGWSQEYNSSLRQTVNGWIHEDREICKINNKANDLTDRAFRFIGR